MSLTIHLTGYGKEYFRKNLIEYINEVLDECNLPSYHNKHVRLPSAEELPSISWSWRKLRHLQFVAIQLAKNPTWRPPEDSFYEQKASQSCYQKFYDENNSHLICCARYNDGALFVPIEFPKNSLLNCNHHLCYFGSSFNLRNELKIIAYKLGFDLRKYDPNIGDSDILAHEKFMMFQLYQMTIKSIEYNLIIEFN
jgi:hypothetical protein